MYLYTIYLVCICMYMDASLFCWVRLEKGNFDVGTDWCVPLWMGHGQRCGRRIRRCGVCTFVPVCACTFMTAAPGGRTRLWLEL